MKKITLYSIATFLTIAAHAQKITFSGKVVDENHKSISFASITILKDTNVVANKISAEDGGFTILLNNIGTYMMKVEHVSYSDYTKELSFTKEIYANGSLDTQTIVLAKEAAQLNEVVVTARKPFITRKIDRVVMNVDNNALSGGKSSLELFQMAPGVLVLNGAISINGNSATKVMVDGKLLHLSGNDLTNYLNSLRAEDIQSIEVIAHPPAEYDAEGTGGILNIIMKKNRAYGLTGSVNAGYSQGVYGGTNEGFRLDYKERKLSLFANYSYSHRNDFDDYILTRKATATQNYLSTDNALLQFTNQNIDVGGVYDIDDKQYIGVEYSGYFGNQNGNTNANSVITDANPLLNQTVTGNYSLKMNSNMNTIGLNYHHTLDSIGSNYDFSTDYTTFSTKQNNSVQSNFYDYNDAFLNDTIFKYYIPTMFKIFTAELKFKKVFAPSSILNFGGKITATSIGNSATYNSFVNNTWIDDPQSNYTFQYNENIYALYASYNGKYKKLEYQLGLRGEYTGTKSNLVSQDSVNTNNYFDLFPTIYLKYPVNKAGNDFLTATYTRRVNRPSFSNLNPWRYYVDNYSIGEGNPQLQPSFENSYNLEYSYHNKYSALLFYSQEKAVAAQYVTISPTDSLLNIYKWLNLGNKTSYGIYLNGSTTVTKWWNMNNDFTLREDETQLQDFDLKRTIVEIKTNQSFTLPKQYSFNLSAYYINHIIQGSFIVNQFFTMDIGIQKKFFNNKLTIMLSDNDIFNHKVNADIYYSANNVGKMVKHDQWHTFSISAVYNFNLGKAFNTKSLEHSNAEERGRL
jgi:outer membrane receptor protein involved in Fe transport